MELIYGTWPWYIVGPLIFVTMVVMLLWGKRFGISSNFQTICTICGAGKVADYFKVDWRKNQWNLVFIAGTIVGGYLASQFLISDPGIGSDLVPYNATEELGVLENEPGESYVPTSIFSWEGLMTTRGFIMIVIGGFLVGFGVRYGNGCTSGHAISGLSNLQVSSLIAVIGFFIGGLFVTWILMPYLLTL